MSTLRSDDYPLSPVMTDPGKMLMTQWIYPFASTIDKPDLAPPKGEDFITIKRDSCAESLPIPEGSKAYPGYGPGEGIEVCTAGHEDLKHDTEVIGLAQEEWAMGGLE